MAHGKKESTPWLDHDEQAIFTQDTRSFIKYSIEIIREHS